MKRTKGEWVYEKHGEGSRFAGNIVARIGKTPQGYTEIRTIDCLLRNGGIAQANADAEYIVKAVNNYDLLVEALQNVVSGIRNESEDSNPDHSLKSCVLTDWQCNYIESVLALAKTKS